MKSIYSIFVEGQLMDDLLDKRIGLFSPLFITMVVITVLGFIVFYYVLNNKKITRSNKFANNRYWLIIFLITLFMVFLIHFLTCIRWAGIRMPRNPEANDESITYFFNESYIVFFKFAFFATVISSLFFYLLSIFFRFRSDHAKNILPPF